MTLREWLSGETIFETDKCFKYLDVEVEQEYCSSGSFELNIPNAKVVFIISNFTGWLR